MDKLIKISIRKHNILISKQEDNDNIKYKIEFDTNFQLHYGDISTVS
jgi:hypothetical protein